MDEHKKNNDPANHISIHIHIINKRATQKFKKIKKIKPGR
jgi:hypothetical protein